PRGNPPGRKVPRTRSWRTSCSKCDRELRVQRGTRIAKLLVVLRFRSSHPNMPRVLANFGIGPLVQNTPCRRGAADISMRWLNRNLTSATEQIYIFAGFF